jgi:hypothetical protein
MNLFEADSDQTLSPIHLSVLEFGLVDLVVLAPEQELVPELALESVRVSVEELGAVEVEVAVAVVAEEKL